MQSLAGDVTRVYAHLANLTQDCPLDDVLAVHFTFASGATGYLCAIASTPFHQHITIFGDKMWMESREISNVHMPDPAVLSWRQGAGEIMSTTYPHADTVSTNLNAWADAVAGRGGYRFSRHHLLHNVQIIEAIVTSAASGEPVAIG
jgi:predicted dehydrogenase